jgi:P27 family predicted phage terminase small subunit
MARPKQPIELVIANGRKNLTKAEIKERREREVKPIADDIVAPEYLTKKQAEEFYKISAQLEKLKIMGETDVDALARYIISKDLYVKLSKQLNKSEIINNPILLNNYLKNQNKMFNQCRASASDLGLTISSRCKLVVPATNEEQKKENRFGRFEKRTAVNE